MAKATNAASISVDGDFARFGSKSYAINKINTVDVRERKPHGMAPVVIFGILALLFLWPGLTVGSSEFVVIGVICAGIAFWAWRKTRVVEYQLFLMTSSSEAQAFVSRDGDEVDSLRHSIERAMSRRVVPA